MIRTQALLVAALMVATLAGCSRGVSSSAVDETSAAGVAADAGACQAVDAGFAIGRQGTQALIEQARQASGARTLRVLKPGDMATLDYRSERLNVNVDDQGVIRRINCG
ncbi:I78 family peptidase inhibitor [Pseudomonas sp. RP23018S]|uniref:I78 family peptidase inhibitor n=1 Tax=Pseudomonas sp. RP23018S TaxID=3096037 RepID=UPI002ACA2944|nr:I78 family peptidase inhibitor [Pseudomonas sp. RP23018S]MDZ5602533.1 I78 family peptidase inhibitor [Pseudomonas sp. RP23018S]